MAVSANVPVVTHVDFGEVLSGRNGSAPPSSCSQPSVVADMLETLDVWLGNPP
jgi:hypothetical protein